MAKQAKIGAAVTDLFARTEPPAPAHPPLPEPPEVPIEELATVACRMTKYEKADLEDLADLIGVPPSYLARWLILEGLRKLRHKELEMPETIAPPRPHRKRRVKR